jgi:hypothetical protein
MNWIVVWTNFCSDDDDGWMAKSMDESSVSLLCTGMTIVELGCNFICHEENLLMLMSRMPKF